MQATHDYIVERDEQQKVDDFHKKYYQSKDFGVEAWGQTYWMGIPVLKCPLDLWLYQEILHRVRPDLIVECGTAHGGSALYLAHMCELIGSGHVVSIDISAKEYHWARPRNERITYLIGDSVSADILTVVRTLARKKRVLVILDSDHRQEHVARELAAYAPLVSLGSYLIVEDTNINGHPVGRNYGPGPFEAAADFMNGNQEFAVDAAMGKFLLSFNPSGYLCRVKAAHGS